MVQKISIALAVLIFGGIIYVANTEELTGIISKGANSKEENASGSSSDPLAKLDHVADKQNQNDSELAGEGGSSLAEDYGKIPVISRHKNKQTEVVYQALKKGDAKYLSPMQKPDPMTKAEFIRNPEKFINDPQPGRVFETLHPDSGAPELKIITSNFFHTRQDEGVKLGVKTAPKSAVTFVCLDGGVLDSSLPVQTAQADANGNCYITFTPTGGALFDCRILAGSNGAWGQVTFTVSVEPKAKKAEKK